MVEGLIGEMIERNHRHEGYHDGFHAPPYLAPRRPLALLTGATVIALICSDPRLDPRKILVLDGIHSPIISMVRIPGGRASLAIKALAGMQAVLNSGTILVIHHTDCGMSHVTDEECQKHLMGVVPEHERESVNNEKFGEIKAKDFEASIKEDIKVLRESTWIKKNTRFIGLLYDTHTGFLREVDDWNPPDWPGVRDGKRTDEQVAADTLKFQRAAPANESAK